MDSYYSSDYYSDAPAGGNAKNDDYYSDYYYSDEPAPPPKVSKRASKRTTSAAKTTGSRRAAATTSSRRGGAGVGAATPSQMRTASHRETMAHVQPTSKLEKEIEEEEAKKKCTMPTIITMSSDGKTLICGTSVADWGKILLLFLGFYTVLGLFFYMLFTIYMAVEFPDEL